MGFSFLSWNIEHFRANIPTFSERLRRVADHIKAQDPDVFGLFEIEDINILQLIQVEFPNYSFGITDGPQAMEIIVGWRNGVFDQAIFTQKREFKNYSPFLRPGALLTVRQGAVMYNLLYLHTDSGTDASAFGNRFEMFDNVWKLRKAIERKEPNLPPPATTAHAIVMGDLNTMGLFYPTPAKKNALVDTARELTVIQAQAAKVGMTLLPKDFGDTFFNGNLRSNLDHIVADSDIAFVPQLDAAGNPTTVRVRGWNELSGPAQLDFINFVSDHCSLYAEVA